MEMLFNLFFAVMMICGIVLAIFGTILLIIMTYKELRD
jgi:hypothetical protein